MTVYEKLDRYKAELDRLRPFEGRLLDEIRKYYRVGLTWTSNAIEGNTLTESETKILLEDGLTAGGKPLRDTFETIGHARAYDFMFSLLHEQKITEADILTMHRLFYSDIDPAQAGQYRTEPVIITGSQYPVSAPERIGEDMKNLIAWMDRERSRLHPVLFAAELHRRFVFIHPFIDGNGRLARLLMNTALIQCGYLPVVISPVIRHEYISLLEKAHRDAVPFQTFIAEQAVESIRDMMRLLHIPIPKMNK